MDNKRVYSAVIFLLMTLVIINSFVLMGASRVIGGKSVASILKYGIFEKYSDASNEENEQNGNAVGRDDFVGAEEYGDDEEILEDEAAAAAAVQTASGAALIEASSRRVLCDENMNVRCYPASTTKVLTALVVLNTLPLDRVVTVPKEAEGVEGSSIYLRGGDKITVEDLLLGLMLRSGNDAAVALAIEAAGSVQKFALLMNETAASLGAENSHFVNPHGLHDGNHYTTAYDLAMITAAAYENCDFRQIVSAKKAKIAINGKPNYISNKNKLLTLYDGANGVKTGYTKRSGRCLVGGAYRDGMQLISVVLNYGDMWNDTVRLLNYGFDSFELTPIESALLGGGEGKRPVEISLPLKTFGERNDMRYPLRRDGSEYIVIKEN